MSKKNMNVCRRPIRMSIRECKLIAASKFAERNGYAPAAKYIKPVRLDFDAAYIIVGERYYKIPYEASVFFDNIGDMVEVSLDDIPSDDLDIDDDPFVAEV